jgi:hypothetical protein
LKKRKPDLNAQLGEIERLALLGLHDDDILTCTGVEPQTDEEREQIELAIEIGRARGLAEIEEALAQLCAQGNREAIAWWNKTARERARRRRTDKIRAGSIG